VEDSNNLKRLPFDREEDDVLLVADGAAAFCQVLPQPAGFRAGLDFGEFPPKTFQTPQPRCAGLPDEDEPSLSVWPDYTRKSMDSRWQSKPKTRFNPARFIRTAERPPVNDTPLIGELPHQDKSLCPVLFSGAEPFNAGSQGIPPPFRSECLGAAPGNQGGGLIENVFGGNQSKPSPFNLIPSFTRHRMELISGDFLGMIGNSSLAPLRFYPRITSMQTASFLKDLFDLSGKTAVVIGGTGELCGTMAVGLARAGAEVVLGGRIPEKAEKRLAEIEGYGGKGYFVPVDVTSRESLQHLLDTVLERSGQVDILINGAGTNSPTPFLEIPEEEYQRIIDTNLSAVFRACQVFGSYFIEESRAASIINLGSISGLNPLSRVFTYSLSKAAVHNLTRNLAREWGDKDIRVNTLVPGFFPAEQNRKILDESRVLDILRQTPASRFGNADELIGATLLLASAKAGSFITGIEMIVDGGFNAMTI
jgi:NAD(P)-dependent dehydrogenase (short-subunit alcohol dehydrogenase family)